MAALVIAGILVDVGLPRAVDVGDLFQYLSSPFLGLQEPSH
jgi:hypothetical protein